jgi:hypothetical protein
MWILPSKGKTFGTMQVYRKVLSLDVGEKKGAASTMFASFGGWPLTEKYVTRGDPNFLMLKT